MTNGFSIVERFTLIPKENGQYHSFPTLIRHQQKLWVACRSGEVNAIQGHGQKGRVRLFSIDLSSQNELDDCNEQSILFNTINAECNDDNWNDIDAILSNPIKDFIFLVTRDYSKNRGSIPYITRWSSTQFYERDNSQNLHAKRQKISDLFVSSNQKFSIAACFSHICVSEAGLLLMPFYGVIQEDQFPSPALLASNNYGKSWFLYSVLARSETFGQYLNEFSMVNIGNSVWIALLRTDHSPYPLYCLTSKDDGLSWSSPVETGLFGHAPMLNLYDDKYLLTLYRDLSMNPTGIALGVSENDGKSWHRLGQITQYSGNLYDGGYGDLITLNDGKLFTIYYVCDKDLSPWIEGAILVLN